MVVQPGQDWNGDYDTGALHRPTQGRTLVQCQVRADLIVQLDNITPTGPRNEKFSTPGIHGLVGAFSCMRYWSGETGGYFGALRRFKRRTAALQYLNGCLSERHAAAWRAPNRRG